MNSNGTHGLYTSSPIVSKTGSSNMVPVDPFFGRTFSTINSSTPSYSELMFGKSIPISSSERTRKTSSSNSRRSDSIELMTPYGRSKLSQKYALLSSKLI